MWKVYMFCYLVWINEILGASVNQPRTETYTGFNQSCEMIVRRGGIISNGFLVGWGGSLNQFKCQVKCDPNTVAISSAIQWFRVKKNGDRKKIKEFKRRVYAVRTDFNSISTLTFRNFLEHDAGEYVCRAWLSDKIGWKEEHVQITYGCSSPRIICDVNRCIHKRYLCDGIKQCTDSSDEKYCEEATTSTEVTSFTEEPTAATKKPTTTTTEELTTITEKPTTTTEEPPTTTTKEPSTTTEKPTTSTTEEPTTTTEEPTTTTTEQPTTTATEESTTTTKEPTTTTEAPTTTTEEPTTTTEAPTTTTEEPTTTTEEPTTTIEQTTTTEKPTTTTQEMTTKTQEPTTITQKGCDKVEFQCDDGECIPLSSRCNTFPDCIDGSDEENCGRGTLCVESMRPCLDDSGCYAEEEICDGVDDCIDGSDETNCTTATNIGSVNLAGIVVEEAVTNEDSDECLEGAEFQCTDGTCIAIEWVCDSEEDCEDGLDELNCNRTEEGCLESEFVCSEGMCIPGYKVCDRVADCPFAEDEENCECDVDEFECSDGECLPFSLQCDQFPDCRDGSDEENCYEGETTPAETFIYDPYY